MRRKKEKIEMNILDKTKYNIDILLFREKHTCVMQKDLVWMKDTM
jgi:hypothetical protein